MTFRYAVAGIAAGLSLCLPSTILQAQAGTQAPPAPGQPAAAKPGTAPQEAPKGQVIFSRSIDDNGETTTQAGPARPPIGAAPIAQDSERQAVTFTAFDLDVHLRVEVHQIAVRALLTVRNDGKVPLPRVPLQISSSLNWDRIRVRGKDVAFPVATLNSDADHTGQLHEAAVPLDQPLAPGESLQLDVTYSGAVAISAQRLLAIGTPEDVALHSDWDQIDTQFTGLRGFGSVVWVPVSSVPVILGDGARLFDEMGEHKLRLAGAGFRLNLTIEFPHGQAPSLALVNGQPVELNVTDTAGAGADIAGIVTAKLDGSTLGFDTPSLFVAARKAHAGTNLTAWTLPDNEVAVEAWTAAAATVTPFLQGWLGQKPRSQLTLLDLPDPADAPYETGALLVTSLHEGDSRQLEGILAHALTHAWMASPRAWLSEGVAHFMGTLWIEKQQGKEKALSALESGRPALALAEPASPSDAVGQPLAQAIAPVFYRTKATYVLWMLRDVAGDPTLSAALRAYDPSQDLNKGMGAAEGSLEALLERAGTRTDLAWFFADWVDADKGLPDLSIESVFPAPERAGNWLVAVNVANAGYAAAEVPVTVRTEAASVTQRVRVPARSKALQRILIQGKPTEVQVNDGTIPESQATVHITKLDKAADPGNGPASGTPRQP
ncbi:MAG TPA: hypothetical protein VGG62_07905 [Terracidiphilus sp.]